MRRLIASAVVLLAFACRPATPSPSTAEPADCALHRAGPFTSDTIDIHGRPRCRAVFVGDTAIKLGVALPHSTDTSLWERIADSAYALRSPERFGAGYVRVYLRSSGSVRAVHYEVTRREWPPTRIGVRRACTPMTVCQMIDLADTSLVVQWVGDSLVQYDAWTWNAEWSEGKGPLRGILLDRMEAVARPPQN